MTGFKRFDRDGGACSQSATWIRAFHMQILTNKFECRFSSTCVISHKREVYDRCLDKKITWKKKLVGDITALLLRLSEHELPFDSDFRFMFSSDTSKWPPFAILAQRLWMFLRWPDWKYRVFFGIRANYWSWSACWCLHRRPGRHHYLQGREERLRSTQIHYHKEWNLHHLLQ